MNILSFSKQLETRMQERLSHFNIDEDEIVKVGEALTFIREIMGELKRFASAYEFVDEGEEIRFFKEVKPKFLSQYFFYKKIFAIRLFDSFKDTKSRRANYHRLLKQMELFVQKNLKFYEYCMTNKTFLDQQYFTRKGYEYKGIDRDEKFSTGFDTKFAKILANELLKRHILVVLQKSKDIHAGPLSNLIWTGSKTDLVELIYALHGADAFNNGAANIKHIASTFEAIFNVSLGDYYRTFQDLRIRKKSQAPFLDHLKQRFVLRMTELTE